MGETSIAWTRRPRADGTLMPGYTFNPWWGCTKISHGCKHCYADAFSVRVGHGARLPDIWGVNAERRFLSDAHWKEPLRWDRAARRLGENHLVFSASMADVFEGREDLRAPRRALGRLIGATPNLTYLLLTKRPENIAPFVVEMFDRLPPNVWFGTTAEDQEHYDLRWPHLADAATLAPADFISYEPALGPLTLRCRACGGDVAAHVAEGWSFCAGWFPRWVIVGGESGGHARPFALEWARSVVAQCRAARIACFVKQMGDKPTVDGLVRLRLKARGGTDVSEWPAGEWPRDFPIAA